MRIIRVSAVLAGAAVLAALAFVRDDVIADRMVDVAGEALPGVPAVPPAENAAVNCTFRLDGVIADCCPVGVAGRLLRPHPTAPLDLR